jgi:hypothetical protein
VEALEDRNLLNVSSVFDSAGNLVQFAVYQNGSLIRYNDGAATVLANSGVRVAHAFRDPSGQASVDIVYSSGAAVEYDSTGGHVLAASGVLDASRAYDALGNFKLDVVYTTASPPLGPNLTGTLIEYTSTTATKLADNVRWVSNYVDPNGGLGIAVGIVSSGGNLVAFRSDTTGTALLYNSPNAATQDITDYCQTSGPNGAVLSIITFGRFAGTYAVETYTTGAVILGDGTNIMVGG